MTTDLFSSLNPLFRRMAGIGLVAALAVSLIPPAFAQDKPADKEKSFIAIRAEEADSLAISGSGRAALTLSRAPASSSGARLLVVNSAAFPLWSGDLKAQGGQWVTQLDRNAVQALLVANAVHAEFPGAATGGKALRISLLREDMGTALDLASPLVGSEPLFYTPPPSPADPITLSANPDATQVATYAMDAQRYDQELAKYYHKLIAAKASAASLWTDLRTAGRLPAWPASAINAQESAFADIAAAAAAVEAQRSSGRAEARTVVDRWNAAHADAEPIELDFSAME